MVYRNGRGVASFSEYHQAHPDGMTVEQWEASKWRQVERLARGKVVVERTWLAVFSEPRR